MFDKVAEMLAQQLNISKSDITTESRIVDDLGADSLDVVELLMQLEEATDKTIPDDKVPEIKTVGQLVEILEQL